MPPPCFPPTLEHRFPLLVHRANANRPPPPPPPPPRRPPPRVSSSSLHSSLRPSAASESFRLLRPPRPLALLRPPSPFAFGAALVPSPYCALRVPSRSSPPSSPRPAGPSALPSRPPGSGGADPNAISCPLRLRDIDHTGDLFPLGGLSPRWSSSSQAHFLPPFASASSSFLLLFLCLLSLFISSSPSLCVSVPLSHFLMLSFLPSSLLPCPRNAAFRRRFEASPLAVSAAGNQIARQVGPQSQVRRRRQVSSASAGGSTRQVVGGRWRATRRRR